MLSDIAYNIIREQKIIKIFLELPEQKFHLNYVSELKKTEINHALPYVTFFLIKFAKIHHLLHLNTQLLTNFLFYLRQQKRHRIGDRLLYSLRIARCFRYLRYKILQLCWWNRWNIYQSFIILLFISRSYHNIIQISIYLQTHCGVPTDHW